MKSLKKMVLLTASILLATIGLPNLTQAAKCGEVSITEMDWASSQIITEVATFLMENGYGCKVTKVPSSTVPSVASIAETGKPDIVTEMWVNLAPVYSKLEKEGKIKTATKVYSDGGVEGWWIPEYVAKKYPESRTIEGILKNPKLVGSLFHNCPVGWGCRIVNDNLKVAFEFKKHGLKIFNHGSAETLSSSLAAAYVDQKPWLGYYWGPTAILGKYAMVKVDLGPYVEKAYGCVKTKGCTNPQKTAYPPGLVVTGVTTNFAQKNPEIFELMENISFTHKRMSGLLAWKEGNKATIQETAVRFISQNPKMWKKWVNQSARKKLSALL